MSEKIIEAKSGSAKDGAQVSIYIVPPGKHIRLPRPKTARQLLDALGIMEEGAIIARDGKLLTPDRRIWPDDELFVRIVASAG